MSLVIVMPNGSEYCCNVQDVDVDPKEALELCNQVYKSMAAEIERRQAEVVEQEVNQRARMTRWWQRPFRGSLDPLDIRRQLSSVAPAEDDRWFLCSYEFHFVTLACRRVSHLCIAHINCMGVGRTLKVPQTDWSIVVRAYNRHALQQTRGS